MSYINIWIHSVWATKNRTPLLTKNIRYPLFMHIKSNAHLKGIHLDHLNGHVDHVHCLISLDADQCISNVMNLIKGESSFWLNKEHLVSGKFGWQDEYYAVSVSPSDVGEVRAYIRNQEDHHRVRTFQEEYETLLRTFVHYKDIG